MTRDHNLWHNLWKAGRRALRAHFLLPAAGVAGALSLAFAAWSQTPAPTPPSTEPAPAAGRYVGAPSCASSNCHGSTRPQKTFRVLQNEYYTWSKSDPHSRQAYTALFTGQSDAILRNLRLPTKPTETPLCLSCHAFEVPAAQQARRLDVEDAISCEACHGPASGWIQGHSAEDWSHEDSVAAGMTDLRNLEVRSRLCLSCHLGTADRGVDHELIAAGHPVLTFELDNYTQGMPAHWGPEQGTRGARAWAVGQAAAFRAGLDQLARRARSAPSDHWPDFAELSCDTCHHSLVEQRWRKQRPADRPGLPTWSPARWAVLRHLVAEAAPDAREGLDTEVAHLARQAVRFGTPPTEVAASAERASRALAAVLPRLDRAAWDDAQLRRLLLAISGDAALAADKATATQGFLAASSLVAELQARNPRRARAGLDATLSALEKEVGDPLVWKPDRFTSQLARLRGQVEELR